VSSETLSVTINGRQIEAVPGVSIIQAMWRAGIPKVEGVGCLEGVCGSCRSMVQRKDDYCVDMELACQTIVEDGMQVTTMDYFPFTHHTYLLKDFDNSWDLQAQFNEVFPEAKHCRHCGGCDRACPKGLDVQLGVELAVQGNFRDAGDKFAECVMCNLCMQACPERISPNHVGTFSRRMTAYFRLRPPNLISRLEEMRRGEHKIVR